MLARSLKIGLEVALALVVILVATFGILLWRLSAGPVSVDFLTPFLEESFSDPAGGYRVEVGETLLVWSAAQRSVDLRALDWLVYDAEGRRTASVPRAAVRLSLPALFSGVVAPTRVDIEGVRVRFEREPDGNLSFARGLEAVQSGAEPEADLTRVAATVLSELLSKPDLARPLSFLRSVNIRNGAAVFDDRRFGVVWRAPEAEISLRREAQGISGEADFVLDVDGQRTEIGTAVIYDNESELIDLAFSFEDLQPRRFAGYAPGLEVLSGVGLPLDGVLSLTLGLDGRPVAMSFELVGQDGIVSLPELFDRSLSVALLAVDGHMEAEGSRLVIDSVRMALGADEQPGPALSAAGWVEQRADSYEIALEAVAIDVDTVDLDAYWPRDVARGARRWVADNIRNGIAEEARVSARLGIPRAGDAPVRLDKLSGGFSFSGVDAHFLDPLPPAAGLSGSATFDETGLQIDVAAGTLRDLALSEGFVSIYGLDTEDHRIAIDFRAEGPLRSALELLDHPRLGLIAPLGFSPAQAAGQASAQVSFAFPLISDLDEGAIEVAVSGDIAGVALQDAILGQDVEAGDLALQLDGAGMRVSGPLRLAGVPMTVDWRERFTAGDGAQTRIEAEVPRIDDARLAALGLDLSPYVSGAASASIALEQTAGGETGVRVSANLLQNELSVPFLRWRKPPGRPGQFSAALTLRDGAVTAIDDIDLSAGTLLARGWASLEPDTGALGELALDTFAFGDSELSDIRVRPRPDGGYLVSVGEGVLDVAPFLDDEEEEPAADAPEPAERTPLTLSVRRLARVSFGDQRELQDVVVEVDRNRAGWQRVRLDARIPRELWRFRRREVAQDRAVAEKRVVVDYGPADGGYRLEVRTDDMGASLRVLDIFESMEGGPMILRGTLPGPLPDAKLTATVEGGPFRLQETPVLARVLTLASLTGIGEVLSGEGIGFQRITGSFELEDDMLRTDLLRAYGPSLGITAKGRADFAGEDSAITGTLVPAYTINRILGNIPMLGPLLTGGEGEGVLAVVYRMEGAIEDPKITVNPLSALAPGFLRGLFSVPADDDDDTPLEALPRAGGDK